MAYRENLTSVLTGLTRRQLYHLRKTGALVPEVQPGRPPIYSYRDIIALRTISKLRGDTSLQKVRKALAELDIRKLAAHPSEHVLASDGRSIFVKLDEGNAMDLVKRPGAQTILSFEDVIGPFRGYGDRPVEDLRAPHRNIAVNPRRQRGQPTIRGSRIQYDIIASFVDNETMGPEDVREHYPELSIEAIEDAVKFDELVKAA